MVIAGNAGGRSQYLRKVQAALFLVIATLTRTASAADIGTPSAPEAANAGAGGLRIVPSLLLRGTFTDNVDLATSGAQQSDFVTEIMPGIRITENGPRVKLRLAYAADAVISARDSSRSTVRHALDADGTVEAIQQFLFVDVRGNVSQVAINPTGPRAPSNANFTDNRTESRTFQVSPYIRGRVLGDADYTVRYSVTDSRTTAGLDNTQVREATARLSGAARGTNFTWALEALDQQYDFQQAPDTEQSQVRAILAYDIDPQLRVSADAGYERNDFVTFNRRARPIYGGGLQWRPTDRTNISGQWEKRFFGNAWNVAVSHRTRVISFQFTDVRDVTTDAQRFATADRNVLYNLLYNALAGRIPDPAERAIETDRLLSQGGIPPDLNLPPDFLTPGTFITRNEQASVALRTPRNSLAFSVYRSRRDQLSKVESSENFAGNVTERAASVSFSHLLTPSSSIGALTTWRLTNTGFAQLQQSRQWDSRLMYSTRFGPKMSGGLEYRHVRYDDSRNGEVRENALTASLLMQF